MLDLWLQMVTSLLFIATLVSISAQLLGGPAGSVRRRAHGRNAIYFALTTIVWGFLLLGLRQDFDGWLVWALITYVVGIAGIWLLQQRNWASSEWLAGVLAFWTLCGVGLLIQADTAPGLKGAWVAKQTAGCWAFILTLAAGSALVRFCPLLVGRAFGRGPLWVGWGVLLVALGFLFLPDLHRASWAVCLAAAFIVVPSLVKRAAGSRTMPVTITQIWVRWRTPLLAAIGPVVVLLLPARLTGHSSDYAPVLLVAGLTLGCYWAAGQRAGAAGLTAAAIICGWGLYRAGQPARVIPRVQAVLEPAAASSSQGIRAIWMHCRGGLLGRGLDHYATRPYGSRQLADAPLANTDSVFALQGEIFGVVGVVSALVLVAVACVVLGRRAGRLSDCGHRALVVGASLVLAIITASTCGWTVGRLPIAGLCAVGIGGGLTAGLFYGVLYGAAFALVSADRQRQSLPAPYVAEPETQRRRQDAPVWVAVAVLAIIALSVIQVGVLQREKYLATPYEGRPSEALAHRAINSGWVAIGEDGVEFVSERAPGGDGIKGKLERWIDAEAIRLSPDGAEIVVETGAFRETDLTGLGRALMLSQQSWESAR